MKIIIYESKLRVIAYLEVVNHCFQYKPELWRRKTATNRGCIGPSSSPD